MTAVGTVYKKLGLFYFNIVYFLRNKYISYNNQDLKHYL